MDSLKESVVCMKKCTIYNTRILYNKACLNDCNSHHDRKSTVFLLFPHGPYRTKKFIPLAWRIFSRIEDVTRVKATSPPIIG